MEQTDDSLGLAALGRNGGAYRHEPDVQFIVPPCEAVAPHLRRPQRVLLESSTYPGTTDEPMIPILKKSRQGADQIYCVSLSGVVGYGVVPSITRNPKE
jgi:hypothetical protein